MTRRARAPRTPVRYSGGARLLGRGAQLARAYLGAGCGGRCRGRPASASDEDRGQSGRRPQAECQRRAACRPAFEEGDRPQQRSARPRRQQLPDGAEWLWQQLGCAGDAGERVAQQHHQQGAEPDPGRADQCGKPGHGGADGQHGEPERPGLGPPVARDRPEPAVREGCGGDPDERGDADQRPGGPAAAQSQHRDGGSGGDTRDRQRQDARAERAAARIPGRSRHGIGDLHLAAYQGPGGDGFAEQLGHHRARRRGGQQLRPLRCDHDRAVYDPVLDGGAGRDPVIEAVDLEGTPVLLELLLEPVGGRCGARDAQRKVSWRDPGGGPGEGPERDGHHHGDQEDDRHHAAVRSGGHGGPRFKEKDRSFYGRSHCPPVWRLVKKERSF